MKGEHNLVELGIVLEEKLDMALVLVQQAVGCIKMKYIIVFIFFFLFVSCEDCIKADPSTSYDKRCRVFEKEAWKKGRETGVCYKVPEGEAMLSSEVEKLHPNPEACEAIHAEAKKKCDALPPAGPGDMVYTSGSAFYKGGKPICPPSKK